MKELSFIWTAATMICAVGGFVLLWQLAAAYPIWSKIVAGLVVYFMLCIVKWGIQSGWRWS